MKPWNQCSDFEKGLRAALVMVAPFALTGLLLVGLLALAKAM